MALRRAYLLMHRHANSGFTPSEVTTDQFVVLSGLSEVGSLTQRELSDWVACDPNTLRAMLLLLEKKGLVERTQHPTDRRARLVVLTSEGETLQQELWEQSEAFRQNLVAILGPDDTQVLLESLRRIVAALSKEGSRMQGKQ